MPTSEPVDNTDEYSGVSDDLERILEVGRILSSALSDEELDTFTESAVDEVADGDDDSEDWEGI